MENKVNSLKEAIDITLHKYDYGRDNIDIIKKLITNALNGNYKVFTRTPINTREYVSKLGNSGILREMIYISKSTSNDMDEILNSYINKVFKKKDIEELVRFIEQNSNLDKITKKIRYISTNSENDIDFTNNLFSFFSKVFIGQDDFISANEIRYDMLYAALSRANLKRNYATVLKTIDPSSKDMTEMDAVTLVEEYIYDGNISQLMEYINSNQVLSGLLLQNLFDYTYFKKDKSNTIKYELDNQLSLVNDTSLKIKILYQKLLGDRIDGLHISREEALTEVLKNTLALNIYTHNKNSIDYDEKKLYAGEIEATEKQISKRIENNDRIALMLMTKGLSTTIEDLTDIINGFSDRQLDFLSNMFVISRSLSANKSKIDNSIYYGNREQTHIYNLLNDSRLVDSLSNNQAKKIA